MALLPVADGARLLGVHPKTLHHWLQQANVPFTTHPMDARMKCVTEEQIQQVAALHSRPLHAPATTGPVMPKAQTLHPPEQETGHQQTAQGLPTFFSQETELIQRLASLETRMLTLQEQIAQLTLALLQERERAVEQRLTALASLIQPLPGRQLSAPPTPSAAQEAPCTQRVPRPLHPAEHLARSRRPALIEYCAPGIYVIISSQEGEVHLQPDSRAWFDWLATLSSFRFVGQGGRFTAHRGYKHGQQTHFWSASRCVRRHTYKHDLGVTESLTIASLEQIAARLQSDIDAR
jgi:DNA-binding transcriptional MerR regulator